jgi:hypothetical protein
MEDLGSTSRPSPALSAAPKIRRNAGVSRVALPVRLSMGPRPLVTAVLRAPVSRGPDLDSRQRELVFPLTQNGCLPPEVYSRLRS